MSAEELAQQAADRVREIVADAERQAEQIVRDAEAEAARIREAPEAAAAETPGPGPEPAPPPEPPVPRPDPTPPTEPVPEPPTATNSHGGDDAAARLVAMKLAVDGKGRDEIEAELSERFGSADRSALLEDVLARAAR